MPVAYSWEYRLQGVEEATWVRNTSPFPTQFAALLDAHGAPKGPADLRVLRRYRPRRSYSSSSTPWALLGWMKA